MSRIILRRSTKPLASLKLQNTHINFHMLFNSRTYEIKNRGHFVKAKLVQTLDFDWNFGWEFSLEPNRGKPFIYNEMKRKHMLYIRRHTNLFTQHNILNDSFYVTGIFNISINWLEDASRTCAALLYSSCKILASDPY